ncbi:MAG: hypothetical protein COW00_08775 [Bdellovibrio sp. CG12_big_fil_rev_8_21_14_0_65_39_13]|nr:MAG: hypothetical protein COW78_08845 [Bdellovibrio sp. CG22_combo_CG10-13_8_21_14_all_39_27]PIQ59717.1 MAG: hypothetical protein COW00_08775 [Bdellovibrio sp. CG12_big_fil_rev_8_21_14_0_65_39_13]PIR36253.1 MAG: hypothetical protein COV37_04610 [Bdellovibrio sp. CG11_big_fil_rev_8_21_14_0_20_39_38]
MNFNRVIDYFYKDLPNGGRQAAYITVQFAIYFIIYICVISLASFFHFQLNHSLSIIEDWLRLNGWKTLIIAKSISFFIPFKFLIIRFDVRSTIRSLLQETQGKWEMSFLVIIVTNYILFAFLTAPVTQVQLLPSFGNQILIYLSNTFVFSLDIIFIALLDHLYPLNKRSRFLRDITYASLISVLYKLSLQIDGNEVRFLFFQLFLLLQILHWKKLNWLHPLIFILVVIAPLQAWFGLDIILKGEFSPLIPSKNLNWSEIFAILFIYLAYIRFKGEKASGTK